MSESWISELDELDVKDWRDEETTKKQRRGLYRWGIPRSLVHQMTRGQAADLYDLLSEIAKNPKKEVVNEEPASQSIPQNQPVSRATVRLDGGTDQRSGTASFCITLHVEPVLSK